MSAAISANFTESGDEVESIIANMYTSNELKDMPGKGRKMISLARLIQFEKNNNFLFFCKPDLFHYCELLIQSSGNPSTHMGNYFQLIFNKKRIK